MDTDSREIIPWGIHPVQQFVFDELQIRAVERGLGYTRDMGDRAGRAGPKVAWIRFFSNGICEEHGNKPGFLMYTAGDAENTLATRGMQVIGYDANGGEHTINDDNNNMQHRPPPSVVSVDVELEGGNGLTRRVTVKWTCSSLDQLEYTSKYFLSPKVSAIVEWGWDHVLNSAISAIDYADEAGLYDIFNNGTKFAEKIKKSNGNYDAIFGYIVDFSFTTTETGTYECTTVIRSANWLIEGSLYTEQFRKTADGDVGKSFSEFVDKDIDKLSMTDAERKKTLNIEYHGRYFYGAGNPDAKIAVATKWLRMDLVTEIFNQYFSIGLADKNGNVVSDQIMSIDISNTMVCATPMIKSTSKQVLLPNRYAPKFSKMKDVSSGAVSRGTGMLSMVKVGGKADYLAKYGSVADLLTEGEYSYDYDNLFDIIHQYNHAGYEGKSFPIFEDSDDGLHTGGYYGRLKDVYVSVDLIKNAVKSNNAALAVYEQILTTISSAMCGVCSFKIYPKSANENREMIVIDEYYNPYSSIELVNALLPQITVGAVSSSYVTSLGLSVKMDQVMAQQCIMETGTKENSVQGFGTMVNGVRKVSVFVGNDRLFSHGIITSASLSNEAEKSNDKEKTGARSETPEDAFILYSGNQSDIQGNKRAYLIERSPDLMKALLYSEKNKNAKFLYTPIMTGTSIEIGTSGISGFNFLGIFTLNNVPKAYSCTNAVWQIDNVKHTIANKSWKTIVTAKVRPIANVPLQ